MAKKSGLGRGLDSLFQDTGSFANTEKQSTATLKINDIQPDKDQPRKTFDEQALTELAKSIEQHGVLQPIVVRPTLQGGYTLVAGERRWRAARRAGLLEIPVIIKEITENDAMEIALIENLQREDLDPIEEALGYKQLMERCNYTQETVAKQVSKSRSAVANALRLLNLPEKVLQYIKEGKLSSGHAKVILALTDAKEQQKAADEIVKNNLNVREAEKLIKEMQKNKNGESAKQVVRETFPQEVEISLREVLGTQVNVKYKNGAGSLSVEFYSDEQLKAFANLLGKYK